MPCAAASCRSTGPAPSLVAAVAAEPVGGSRSGGGARTGRHSPECDCLTCERLTLGEFAYRELAEELGSDDPEVIDPIWRARCEARIADSARSAASQPPRSLDSDGPSDVMPPPRSPRTGRRRPKHCAIAADRR
jgi:hypothetical protein